MYHNKATIIGNLTRDPELKALPSGMHVCSFSIATNRSYKDRDGKRAEQTDYHNIIVFGGQAEACARFLRKGSQALVEGRLQTRSWENAAGKHYRTEIIAEVVQFGSRPKAGDRMSASEQEKPETRIPEYPDEEINPEDIPF